MGEYRRIQGLLSSLRDGLYQSERFLVCLFRMTSVGESGLSSINKLILKRKLDDSASVGSRNERHS